MSMIHVKTFVFNPIQTNTFVLSDDTRECVIIDAGNYYQEENEEIIQYISKHELKPVRMINTHGHIDHILGIVELSKQYGIKAEMHRNDLELIAQAGEYGAMFALDCKEWPVIDTFLEDRQVIRFGNETIEAIHTPGHTQGGMCFYSKSNQFVIAGDTLFANSIGRTDLPGGNYDQIIESIKTRLFTLDEDVKVYSGHGSPTTIGYEKKNNPFLH